MFVSMLVRKFLIEAIYSALFLAAFHWVATTPFETFVTFALFTIFLRTRSGNDFAELRAQNYLLLRMARNDDEGLSKLATNMGEVFDEKDLLSQFSDENKGGVAGEYSGQIFSRIVSWAAQAWMLFWIARAAW